MLIVDNVQTYYTHLGTETFAKMIIPVRKETAPVVKNPRDEDRDAPPFL